MIATSTSRMGPVIPSPRIAIKADRRGTDRNREAATGHSQVLRPALRRPRRSGYLRTAHRLLGMHGMKATALAALVLLFGCSADDDLAWIAPDERVEIPIGDAIELAVVAGHPDAHAVTFAIDGTERATCDPAQLEEDCRRDDVWRWTTVFATPGTYAVSATLVDRDGVELAEVTTNLVVVPELILDGEEIVTEPPEVTAEDTPAPDDAVLAAGRGRLDPDRPFHRIFGGIAWRVDNQRVKLHTGTPRGSADDIARCMNRFGASIRRWADHYRISRASVVATALTESNCTNPAGSSDGLSSGPMQVTGSTCAALTGLSSSACRRRMHQHPDFSFRVGAKYIGSSFQRSQHRRDPPKIAADYNAGSLRRTSTNRWHMVSTGNHIDRFVRHYNAYRTWENR
jgi:hypothetical protein